jgi:hypothetical protein
MDGSGNFACSYPTAIQITQTAHGFAVGNSVYYNNSGPAYALVLSTDASFGDQGVGIVSKVVSANVFEFVPNGFIGGLAGLTANTYYYLSSVTAGAMSTSAPTTGYTLPVFYALSTTTGTVLPWKPMYKSGAIVQTAYTQTSGLNGGTAHGQYQFTSPGSAAFVVKIRAGCNNGASVLNRLPYAQTASYLDSGYVMYSWLKVEEIQP